MSKKPSTGLVFKDGRDKDFSDTTNTYTQTSFHIRAVYQGGNRSDHLLAFQRNTLTSTGEMGDPKTKIRVQYTLARDFSDRYDLWVIGDPDSPSTGLKLKSNDDGSYSFTVESNPKIASLNSANDAEADPEIQTFLLKKFSVLDGAGTSQFFLTSYSKTTDNESVLLAVDDRGYLRMDNPPTVNENNLMSVASDNKNLFKLV